MSDELELVAPRVSLPSETVVIPMEVAPPGVTQEEPRLDQMRASEEYFASNREDTKAASAVLGMWASTLLLHDLAVEHFEGREEKKPLPRRWPGQRPENEDR